jgi:hypothetical protein
MAATIEVKYFNSYWLKKIESVQSATEYVTVWSGPLAPWLPPGEGDSWKFTFVEGQSFFTYYKVVATDGDITPLDIIGPGQKFSYTYTPVTGILYEYIIIAVGPGVAPDQYKIYLDKPIGSDDFTIDPLAPGGLFVPLTFGKIVDFNYVPGDDAYISNTVQDWFIEESRIQGGYNNVSTDLGVRAFLVDENPAGQRRTSSIIYSGVFNSRTGINNTNQFSVGEDIVKSLDPSKGSIQKLYAEDTNLIIFQEMKVNRALIDKSAVYSAEGKPMTTSGAQVIGEVQAYAGNYGISTNPESFAVYGYRKYFTDRTKNAVLRLSQDGITEISNTGMLDYFRDNLGSVSNDGKVLGSWDMHNKQYVLSMQPALSPYASRSSDSGFVNTYQTLTFDEDTLGWTSRFSFRPDNGFSLLGEYYTAAKGNLWKHYSTNVPYCNFYSTQYSSNVTLVFNPDPSYSKTFKTINYEGSSGWALTNIYTESSNGAPVLSNKMSFGLSSLQNELFTNNFKVKENKYFGNLFNISPPTEGAIVYGQSMSGISGFYAVGTFTFPDPYTLGVTYNNPTTLFATSLEYN